MTLLVTGATGGVGPHITDHLVEKGAEVHGTYLYQEEKENAGKRAEHEIQYHEVDLTDEEAVEELADELDVDGVVNLVGGFSMGEIEDTSKDDLVNAFELHAATVFLVLKHFQPEAAVNFSSKNALESSAGTIAYNVGKTAVKTVTETADAELDSRINAIAPTIMDTPANRESMPDADFEEWTPPGEVAKLVEFLLTGESSTVAGQTITI